MSKVSQSMEDFNNRLNLSIFSNIEKSLSSKEIKDIYGDDCMILEKSVVESFISDVYKGIGGEIKKGGFNDIPEAHEILKKAEEDIKSLVRVTTADNMGIVREVFVMKAKTGEEIQKAKENELEKGHISNAFSYSSLLKFEKTGLEIKEKAKMEKIHCENELKEVSEKIATFLSTRTGDDLPTEKPYLYGLSEKVECPYLIFHYCLTDYWEGRDLNNPYTLQNGKLCYPSASSEDAANYRSYNQLVDKWIDEKREIVTLDLFINNFEDKKKYELNAEQMIALGF